jgi:hypothetical protein
MKKMTRHSLALVLFAILLVSPLTLPQRAHAQIPVTVTTDVSPTSLFQLAQQTISAVESSKNLLNPIFYRIAQAAIQSMVRSTVNWINNGFQGSPAFATDLKGTLLDAADREAEGFVRSITANTGITSPFQNRIAQNVLAAYYLSTSRDAFYLSNPYTLNRVTRDDAAFLRGDFSQGGFSAWFAETLNLPNSERGFNELARSAFYSRIDGVKGQIHEELGWGNGIFSWRKCDKSETYLGVADKQQQGYGLNLAEKKTCLESHIETPGTVIAGTLNKHLGLGADSLIQADSFDEIVNALLSQLINQVIGGGGLRSVSRASGSTGRAYFDQPSSVTASAGVSVVGSFTQILDEQASELQSYVRNWQTINTAALTARSALQQSTCVPGAASIITNEVEPVISKAAQVAGSVPTTIAEVERIRQVALGTVTNDTTSQLAALQQANADYQNLISATSFPSLSDFSYAQEQSQDTGSASPASLVTKMNQLASRARCGT